ncbi:hypothetical protein [Duganella sp. BuS-21]|uniref:hypothetical protein n=1 Tax=Duganella sp. BuS-21 TaxID=2943848 RepID=UPI0035A5EA0E
MATPTNSPFNFDGSGWVINFGDGNTVKASGNSGANEAAQTPATGGSLLGNLGINQNMLLIAAVVLLLMRRNR